MVKLLLNVLFNKGKLKIILILIIFILTPLISFAQGTTCATATPITINGACATGTISDTTQDLPNIGTCSGTFRSEGWYTFNVTGGPLNLNISGTMGANNRDLFLELISSSNNTCTGTLNQIACANSFNTNPQTEVINTTLSNGTYFIKVVNVGSNASMSLTSLCVTSNTGPPNATCATATTLPCATSNLAGTTVGTSSIINGTACSMGDYGVWYTFVGDGNNTTISSTAAFDHEMSVSSGSCGSFTSISCNDSALSGGTETSTFTTVIGTNYYVYISNYLSGSTTTGTFTISRTCSPPPVGPPNSTCATASTLPCATSNLAGTTVGTSSIINGTACSMGDYGVWYTFVGDGNNTTISSTAAFDHEMSVSSGSCGSFTSISCNDSALSGGTETSTFTTVIGTNYYVYISNYLSGSTTTGTFTISRTCSPPPVAPPNATCATATSLPCATSNLAGTTVGTSSIINGTACSMGNYGVWYTFVGDGNNSVISSTASFDHEMSISTGSCGSFTSISCNDSALTGGTETSSFATILGTTYFVYISHYLNGSTITGTFTISRSCVTAGANDNCTGAISLTVNPSTTCVSSTSGTTVGATQSQAGCSGTADDDVWYSFVATSTSHTVTVVPSGISDIIFQVFNGSCGSLTSVDCVDDTISSTEATLLTGLTLGNTYLVRVYSYSSGSGQGAFTICVTSNIPCTAGTGNGTTTLACPNIVSGGLGLNGLDPNPVNACASSACVDLEATYLPIAQTTSYAVQNIAYSPPYQFDCLQNSVSINVDDVWSPAINLPFNFCYYGTNYNQCLIGSNGTLTFDLTSNAPSGYSAWSFANNLPNNTLFLNTIFGVYHDIDPSKGGQVGWELITLNNGCRALVASWNNIPMFSSSCNSILYTGMIVLYENTNIIEVYIKEKNLCSTWNGGNAIVGIQNSNGSQAVVAPSRNGLDTDWTTTNEAWRFTPSGASLTSIKWYQGSGTSGPVVGTTNIVNVCPSSTTIYTAEVTYTLCSGNTFIKTDTTTVTVSNNKTWNGSVDNDWNKPANWTPNSAIPNGTDCVIIPTTPNNPLISGTNYSGFAGTLSIYNGATLTVNSNNHITITDWINVQASGTFLLNNSSNLVQINNVSNTGNIIYKRNANIRTLDYVYWSSPVSSFNVNNIASPIIPGPIYSWNSTLSNPNGGQGYWVNAAGSPMSIAKGYIVRGPSALPFNNTTNTILNGSFTGIPNNGTITIPISRGNDQNTSFHTGTNGTEITNFSDNWNLLGNPYPSSIRGSQFLFNNKTKIEGNINLWTHGNLPAIIANPFYASYLYNYTPGDYLTFNFTGTSCCPAAAADLFIGAGQGFFVQMIDGPIASDIVTFNNGLRNATYDNSLFYRSSQTPEETQNLVNIERHRIWLDIINSINSSNRTLIGYVEGATMERDSFFDSKIAVGGTMSIYSLIEDNRFNIQGRSLPFNKKDEVPLGVNIPNAGTYSIAIAGLDGLFNNHNIYLKDSYLNIIYNIKANPYRFTSLEGTINDRFSIVYKNGGLNKEFEQIENEIKVVTNDKIEINSSIEIIKAVTIFDVLGRKLAEYNDVNSQAFIISNLIKNNTSLLLNITLINDKVITKKVIF